MKQKQNRLKVNRLFLFGAGASYCATSAMLANKQGRKELLKTAPLDKDFCRTIKSLDSARPTWVQACRDYLLYHFKDHAPFETLGLEQAIIQQIGHLEFIEGIHRRRRSNASNSFEYLNKLAHIICFVLRRTREVKNGPYSRFFKKVFLPKKNPAELKDRIITFNYDELLDKYLLNTYSLQEVYFDKIKAFQTESGAKRKEKFEDPILIKLHGSVNWRCGTKEFESIVKREDSQKDSYYIESIWHSKVGTPSPDDDSSPLIIPPLPFKPVTKIKIFSYLWTKAYEYLHEAQEIIICGYSLPEADNLARSLFGNFTNKIVKSVTVVDPNPLVLNKWRQLFTRRNVNKNIRWMYNADFDEFVSSLGN